MTTGGRAILDREGAGVNATDDTGWTPLLEPEWTSEVVRAPIQAGADVKAEIDDGRLLFT